MSKISFIYFDVGGVTLKDFSGTNKWQEMKSDLGFTERNYQEFDRLWDQSRERVCIDYDVDQLVPTIREQFGLSLPDSYSMLEDFVNRFEENRDIWPIIKSISKDMHLGLLTNMYPRMLNQISSKNLLGDFIWDVVVDSSMVGYQKPDSEIFEYAEKKANVPVGEILFIDNSKEHVAAARSRGWQAFVYDSSDYDKANKDLAAYLQPRGL